MSLPVTCSAVLAPTRQPSRHRLARTDLHHSRQRRICGRPFRLPCRSYHRGLRRVYACVSRPSPRKMRAPLREGQIDLEIGVLGVSAPEVRTQSLFRDRFVGVARIGHPLFSGTAITPERYAACDHVVASRKGNSPDRSTTPLKSLGSNGRYPLLCLDFLMRCGSHVSRTWSRSCRAPASAIALQTVRQQPSGLQSFELPVRTPEIVISAMWHPRMDADPAHRWLRDTVAVVCRAEAPR